MSHHKLNKNFLFLSVIILVILGVMAVFYSFNNSNRNFFFKPKNSKFQDPELGVAFQYPRQWGKASVKETFSLTQILREISFSNEEQVRFISSTPYYLYPAWFEDEQHVFLGDDPRIFCEEQLVAINYPVERNQENKNLFRLNGKYAVGDCQKEPPTIFLAQKKYKDGSINNDAPNNMDKPMSKIDVSEHSFWALDNSVYPSLTLIVNISSFQTDSVCTLIDPRSNEESKNAECLSYQDKEGIDKIFQDYNLSNFASQIKELTRSVTIESVPNVQERYESKFSAISYFDDAETGLYLEYPSVFGSLIYQEDKQEFIFFNDKEEPKSFRLRKTKRDDAILGVQKTEECETMCQPPLIDELIWDSDYELLKTQSKGVVNCPASDKSLIGSYSLSCMIVDNGSLKKLIRYYTLTETGEIAKEYVLYTGNTRFDFLLRSDSLISDDLSIFREKEKDDFNFKILENMSDFIGFL